jgi:formylglycine-generating enzyme required for sulfatase activity
MIKKKFVFMLIVLLLILVSFNPYSMAGEKEQNTFTSPITGAKFVLIQAGTFTMGEPRSEFFSLKEPNDAHQVTISKPFYMQTTTVTQGQWQKVMGTNPSDFKNCGDDCPVERVTWNDVQNFIKKLNLQEGTDRYRLPTEAEWEYAARAGTTTPFYTGKCLSTDQANYNGNYPPSGCPKGEYRKKPVRVGSFAPNAWGLYDMLGNVWQWCQDWYGKYPAGPVTDPVGPPSGSNRICRGGSWYDDANDFRSAVRGSYLPHEKDVILGFRLVRTP